MKNKFMIVGTVTVLAILFLSLSPLIVSAQYQTRQTADVTISSSGTAHVDQSSTVGNVAIDIVGVPGATGSVSTATYTGNPQPNASMPDNTVLSHYVVVTFNIPAADFVNATITITFTDADIAGMAQPYVLYKYNPDTNAYNALDAVVDYNAHTITAVVTSTTDPLFAIGGTVASTATPTVAPTGGPTTISGPTWAWIAVGIETVMGVILVIGLFIQQNRSDAARSKKSS